jgi:UDP-N-acetylmuramoyl-L-alanyl-D-glutamate--2,6-diaminopimelate ligase
MKMKLPKSDLYITDNTQEIASDTLLLKTQMNARYISDEPFVTINDIKSHFELDKIKIVALTGTNGKTTTAALIYSILLDLGYKVGFQGTRGFYINDELVAPKSLTTPLLLNNLHNIHQAINAGCDFFITEVSSHAIDQERVEGLDFAMKILTNITQDHLDFHKTMQNYIDTKNSFFADESVKLINKDEKRARFNFKNAYTYALETNATYTMPAYSLKDGLSGVVKFANETPTFFSSLYGEFNLYNILASISAVHILTQRSLDEICQMVSNFGGVSGRMEVVSQSPLIIVDFAHTPDGMDKVLSALQDRVISLVFGAGGNRDRSKRPLMGRVASRYAKKITLTSDNPRDEAPMDIINDIKEGLNKEATIIEDRQAAIKHAYNNLETEEILVILGKGDETYQEVKGQKHPFDDREVVSKLLETL